MTDEKYKNEDFVNQVPKEYRVNTKGIEVGHIFYFGDKYSKPMKASVDYKGKKEFVKMGSYGIGVSRLVGAIIEAKYDAKNEIMKWPLSVSPFDCAIIPIINKDNNQSLEKALNLSNELKNKGIDFLIDDTDESFSSKIKKFNLIGIPFQIIIGNKNGSNKLEFQEIGEEKKILTINEIANLILKRKQH